MKNTKKIMAGLICLLMIVSMFPTVVLANDGVDEAELIAPSDAVVLTEPAINDAEKAAADIFANSLLGDSESEGGIQTSEQGSEYAGEVSELTGDPIVVEQDAAAGNEALQSMQVLTDSYRLVVESSSGIPESVGGESVALGNGAYVVEFDSAAAQENAKAILEASVATAVSKDVIFSIDSDDDMQAEADSVVGIPSEGEQGQEPVTSEQSVQNETSDEPVVEEPATEEHDTDDSSVSTPVTEVPVADNPTIVEVDYRAVAGGRPLIAVIDTGSNSADAAVSVIDTDGSDDNGHGTRMTNLIRENAGSANPYILSIKALNFSGAGNMSDVYAAVQYAISQRVDYINMSISANDSDDMDAFKSAIQTALDAGIVVIASAGNARGDAGHLVPANIGGVITCGAVNEENAVISNYGDSVDFFLHASSSSDAAAIMTGKMANGFNPANYDDVSVQGSFPDGEETRFAQYGDVLFHTNRSGTIWYDGWYNVNYQNITVGCGAGYWLPRDYDPDTIYQVIFLEWGPQDNGDKAMDGQGWSNIVQSAIDRGVIPPTILVEMDTDAWNQNQYNYAGSTVAGLWARELENLINATRNAFSNTYLNQSCECDARAHIGFFAHSQGAAFSKTMADRNKGTIGLWGISGGYQGNIDGVYWFTYDTTHSDTAARNKFTDFIEHFAENSDGCECDAKGTVTVQKESSMVAVTNGRSRYSLAGAQFQLYSDAACTQPIADTTMTTGEDGKSNTIEIKKGTYYLKEITASPGYKINTSVFNVTVESKVDTTVNVKEEPQRGYAKLRKESANPDVTDGNACYSLAGAVYTAYKDVACTSYLLDSNFQVITFTTDESGVAVAGDIPLCDFYVKETVAPRGYALPNPAQVQMISVTADNLTADVAAWAPVTFTDVPENDPVVFSVQKMNESGSRIGPTLDGAQFTINYYDGFYESSNLPATPKRTWVIETKRSASTGESRAMLSDSYIVSGSASSPLYKDSDNDPILPLGTITVRETKAPAGYTAENPVYITGGQSYSQDLLIYQIKDESGNGVAAAYFGNSAVDEEIIQREKRLTPGNNALVIRKTVTGNRGSHDEYFEITVEVSNLPDNRTYTLDRSQATADRNPSSFKTDANGNATFKVWLQHGQQIGINEFPALGVYEIYEDQATLDNEGYTASVNGRSGCVIGGQVPNGTTPVTVSFTNRRVADIPTRFDLNIGLALLPVVAVLGFAYLFIQNKRKKTAED